MTSDEKLFENIEEVMPVISSSCLHIHRPDSISSWSLLIFNFTVERCFKKSFEQMQTESDCSFCPTGNNLKMKTQFVTDFIQVNLLHLCFPLLSISIVVCVSGGRKSWLPFLFFF